MLDYQFKALVEKAAAQLKKSNGSRDAFYKITQQVVVGSGIRNKSDLQKLTSKVREELTARSSNARSSHAAARRVSEGIAKRRANER